MTRRMGIGVAVVLLLIAGCGGGGSNDVAPPPVLMSVTPTTANVHINNTQQFTSAVENTTNTAVTWSLTGSGCSGTACGTIDANGLYTAPAGVPAPATVSVKATSAADSTKSDTAVVTVLDEVVVAVTPSSVEVPAGLTQQFTATVDHAVDGTVTWAVSGPVCSGSACGTITTAGLYTAPASLPSPASVQITATSVEDPTKSANVMLTVKSNAVVTVWPAEANVAVTTNVNYGADARQFGAMVTGATNTSVTWSVSGAGCSGNTCGTITDKGMYLAPATVTNPVMVTVTATSQEDSSKNANATVYLVPEYNGKLNGTYAFFYQGFALGAPSQTGGVLTADGHGNITYGVLDRTWPDLVGGNLQNVPFTGTYNMIGRSQGTITINGSFGTVTFAIELNATGKKGFIQPFFNLQTRMLGTIEKIDGSALNNAGINGDYVFQVIGSDSGNHRQAGVGRLHADGNGNITSGAIDVNDDVDVTNSTFTGTYSVSQNGRTTISLVVTGEGSMNYVGYVVSAKKFFLFSMDHIDVNYPMMGGAAYLQTGGPFSKASLNTTTVFNLLGGVATVDQAAACIGLLKADGKGGATGTADLNNDNVMSLNVEYTATYSIDANGRGTLTTPSAVMSGLIFYMMSPNKALLMEAPGYRVMTGSLEAQTQLSYNNSLLAGNFAAGGPTPPSYPSHTTVTGEVQYDGNTSYTVWSHINSLAGGLWTGSSSNNPYSVAASGRVTFTPTGGGTAYAYMISPVKYVEILGTGFPTAWDDQRHLYCAEQ